MQIERTNRRREIWERTDAKKRIEKETNCLRCGFPSPPDGSLSKNCSTRVPLAPRSPTLVLIAGGVWLLDGVGGGRGQVGKLLRGPSYKKKKNRRLTGQVVGKSPKIWTKEKSVFSWLYIYWMNKKKIHLWFLAQHFYLTKKMFNQVFDKMKKSDKINIFIYQNC